MNKETRLDFLSEALAYYRLGLGELFKDKKFLLSYIVTIAILAMIVAVTSTELYIDDHKIISTIYGLVISFSVTMASEIYAIYAILGRYRKLQTNTKTVLMCLCWAVIVNIISLVYLHFIFRYLGAASLAVTTKIFSFSNFTLIISGVLTNLVSYTLLASFICWCVFYPCLVMEGFLPHPIMESFKLARKNYVSLIAAFVLVWCPVSFLRQYLEHGTIFGIIPPPSYDNLRIAGYIGTSKREFLQNTLLLFPMAVSTAAFLRLTNEVGFTGTKILPRLIKED